MRLHIREKVWSCGLLVEHGAIEIIVPRESFDNNDNQSIAPPLIRPEQSTQMFVIIDIPIITCL